MKSIWSAVVVTLIGYAIFTLMFLLFLEGLLGGCDTGKCLFF